MKSENQKKKAKIKKKKTELMYVNCKSLTRTGVKIPWH